jgi:hypothetical protein
MEKRSRISMVVALSGVIAAIFLLQGKFAKESDQSLDPAMRAKAIDALVAKLNDHYVFPDKARKMTAFLRRQQQEGKYDGIDNGYRLAKQLTADLHGVARDLHMRVGYHPAMVMSDEADRPAQGASFLTRLMQRRPASARGVELVGRLGNDIGYLKITSFPDARLMRDKFAEAMNDLAGTDGLIMDLRGHRGGDPLAVVSSISYFVDGRTRLNDIWERDTGNTVQHWTEDKLAGRRYGARKPVMILVDSGTGSAGEDFAYTMQALKRATVIGERTWGGAHPVRTYRLGGHFYASIPNRRSISPITGTNWEGVGVTPDIDASPDSALAVAKDLMLRRLRERAVLVAAPR